MHFEALEQTLRLRLVSGPADKKFSLIIGSAPTPTVLMYLGDTAVVLEYGTKFSTLPMSMTLDVYPVLNLATWYGRTKVLQGGSASKGHLSERILL